MFRRTSDSNWRGLACRLDWRRGRSRTACRLIPSPRPFAEADQVVVRRAEDEDPAHPALAAVDRPAQQAHGLEPPQGSRPRVCVSTGPPRRRCGAQRADRSRSNALDLFWATCGVTWSNPKASTRPPPSSPLVDPSVIRPASARWSQYLQRRGALGATGRNLRQQIGCDQALCGRAA